MTKQPFYQDTTGIRTTQKHFDNLSVLLTRTLQSFPFEPNNLKTEDIPLLLEDVNALLRQKVKESLKPKKENGFTYNRDKQVDQLDLGDTSLCSQNANGSNTYLRSNALTKDFLSFFIVQDGAIIADEILTKNFLRSRYEVTASTDGERRLIEKANQIKEILTEVAEQLERKGVNYSPVRDMLNNSKMFQQIEEKRYLSPSFVSEYGKAF